MKTLILSMIVIMTIVASMGINTAYGHSIPSPFVSNTDKSQYNSGETIRISGMVANSIVIENQTVKIDVYGPDGKLYENSTVYLKPQQNPYSNGYYTYGYTYEHDVKTENKTIPGPYQIVAHYDKDWKTSNTVTYDPLHVDYEKYYTYNAFFGDLLYQIQYKITQAHQLQGLSFDVEGKMFYISERGMENKTGYLILDLPRVLIDSKTSNATDMNFSVASGGTGGMIAYNNNFKEIQKNDKTRTLQFDLPSDISNYIIMVFGTTVNQTQSTITNDIQSPLKQFKSGILAQDVKCEQNFQLVIKVEDGSPACVKPDTVNILLERGWAGTYSNISTIVIPKDSDDLSSDKNFEPQYLTVILGVNNTVSWINKSDAGNEIDATHNQPDPMFENGPYSHGTILPGKSFNFTFTKPGEFEYHAQPHPWLQGSVLVLPQSPENATQTVVLSNTTIPGPCEMFGLPCPLNADRTFTAQKFGNDIYIEKITGNGIDHYAVIHPTRSCTYPPGHNVSCTNPDDLAILKLIGVNIPTVS